MTVSGVLDDPSALRRYDAEDMLGAIAQLPTQIRVGWDSTRALSLPARHHDVHAVVLLGMGGSAIAGDLVRATFTDRLKVPLITVRDYELPAFVGPESLVVAASFSGATEETVSSLAAALTRRCPVAVITTGGPLKEVALRAELPLLSFPGGGQPRAAVGWAVSLLGGLLERAGLLELDDAVVLDAAAAASSVVERCRPTVPTEQNQAKQLAWSLVDRLPVIEASGFLAAVARRWKTQFNENGKSMAVFEELPEATHNTVVGYAQPEALHERLFVVFLASPADHPRNSLRASLSAELLAAEQIGHQFIPVGGDGRLAQACSAIALGDFVSTYLAILYGLDPTPVEAISRIKARLSAAEEPDD
ncbi:MAG: bifunctional phosphoglucose/phosphomannose isomerase [Chloroflexota bacterium]|nr:bifunctional phosphoglucose/phosphomannose isomerase [Chloroflexota bacterium]